MVGVQDQYLKELQLFCWENNFSLDEMKMERLAQFAELVTEKNESLNLISRKDISAVTENHIFLSAFISKYIPEKCTSFLDIGTGGGFPGIPLAIVKDNMRGILAYSTTKKIEAVKEFIDKLKLSNVRAENYRVESPEFIEKYRNSFDLVVSRATVPIIILLRYSIPLIKEKAILIAIKGGDLTEEYQKAELKYKPYIKKSTFYELNYRPTNIRNSKGKKLVLLELHR